jgi:hypothetical protein
MNASSEIVKIFTATTQKMNSIQNIPKANSCQLKNLTIIFLMIFFMTGCTKEKGETIKFAAEQFMVQSVNALNQIKNLFKQSVGIPSVSSEEEMERIVKDIDERSSFGPSELTFLLEEGNIGCNVSTEIDTTFEKLEKSYYQFADVFHSLPKGSLFSGDAVKKAEKHAVNLTLELINFSEFLKKYPVQFTARRTLILEKIAKDKEIEDKELRKMNLKITAQSILELRSQESIAKEEAIRQCLKAAESGKLVLELIRSFRSLSVADMLSSTRESLAFISEISGSSDISSLLERYNFVESQIRNDPYWKEILNLKIESK